MKFLRIRKNHNEEYLLPFSELKYISYLGNVNKLIIVFKKLIFIGFPIRFDMFELNMFLDENDEKNENVFFISFNNEEENENN